MQLTISRSVHQVTPSMLDRFENSKTEKHNWATVASLVLAFLLPVSGFAGVLAASSSEAEVESFGEKEVEECLVVVQRIRSRRRSTTHSERRLQSRLVVSRTHHSAVSFGRTSSGHRYPNGLLAPMRC